MESKIGDDTGVDSDFEPTTSVIEVVLNEIKSGCISDDQVEILRESLGMGSKSYAEKVDQLSTRISELQSRVKSIESDLDESSEKSHSLSAETNLDTKREKSHEQPTDTRYDLRLLIEQIETLTQAVNRLNENVDGLYPERGPDHDPGKISETVSQSGSNCSNTASTSQSTGDELEEQEEDSWEWVKIEGNSK